MIILHIYCITVSYPCLLGWSSHRLLLDRMMFSELRGEKKSTWISPWICNHEAYRHGTTVCASVSWLFFCSPFPRVFRRFPCRWERSEAAARIDPLRFSMLRDIYTLHSSIIYIYTYTYVKSVDSIFITTCKCSIHDSFDMTFRLIN